MARLKKQNLFIITNDVLPILKIHFKVGEKVAFQDLLEVVPNEKFLNFLIDKNKIQKYDNV